MKPLIQTRLDHPFGNCYGTSIFSIFELDPSVIPEIPKDDEKVREYHKKYCNDESCSWTINELRDSYWHGMWSDWFLANNLTKISIPYHKLESYVWCGFKAYHLMNGRSPRDPEGNRGTNERAMYHTVVGKNGLIWHDPHPSGKGLLTIDSIEFIIPSDPSQPILQGYNLDLVKRKFVDSTLSSEVKLS